jgi:NAD(P)-dependent dehydrogenase (short-subunit alcohol dehydrogenase family)
MAGILHEKISLITGGGSGIGRATAEIFAREGATVVIADVDEAGGQETLEMVRKGGGQGMFVRADVSQAGDVEAMVAAVVEKYGRRSNGRMRSTKRLGTA